MVLKNIKIEEDIWWELNRLKVKLRLKRLSEVISKILREKRR